VAEELDVVREALEALLLARVQEGTWRDKAEAKLVGPIKTMEAISCFTSTAMSFDKLKRIDPGFTLPKMDLAALADDLNGIGSFIASKGYAPAPYCDEDFERIKVPYGAGKTDFVDTASFVISTMLGSLVYHEAVANRRLPTQAADYQRIAKEATIWLLDNAFESEKHAYWSWGPKNVAPDIPSVYFTWSAAVGLAHAYSSKHSVASDAEKKRIKKTLEKTLRWAESVIVVDSEDSSESAGQRYAVNYKKLNYTESFNGNALLVFIAGIFENVASAGISLNQEKELNVVNTFLSIFRAKDQATCFGDDFHYVRYPDPPERIDYRDRSIDYLLLTSLSWFYREMRENRLPIAEEESNELKDYVNYQRRRVIKLRDEHEKLWPAPAFRIYTTQRAIDSLIDWLRYYYVYQKTGGPAKEEIAAIAILNAFNTYLKDNRENLLAKIKETLKDYGA